jgi:outer membrane immunogenic protein
VTSVHVGTTSTTARFSVTGSGRASVDWVSTMRTRFGFVADRAFIYGTAGLAIGGVSQSSWTTLNVNGATTTWTGSKSSTRVGYALGAGIEYALTKQWSIRAQYIYYNLGSSSYSLFSPGATPKTFGTARSELGGSLATFGINYSFGGP